MLISDLTKEQVEKVIGEVGVEMAAFFYVLNKRLWVDFWEEIGKFWDESIDFDVLFQRFNLSKNDPIRDEIKYCIRMCTTTTEYQWYRFYTFFESEEELQKIIHAYAKKNIPWVLIRILWARLAIFLRWTVGLLNHWASKLIP